MEMNDATLITPEKAVTLPGLFLERVRRSPEECAYRFFDALNGTWSDLSWGHMARQVRRWQAALAGEKLQKGDRVAIMARNSRFWVTFDLAALGMGLVVVPLYTEDRVDNVSYVIHDAGVKLLVIGGPGQWDRLQSRTASLNSVKRIVSIAELPGVDDKRVRWLNDWLPQEFEPPVPPWLESSDLATIVYTSGTTGAPKGVMLSHWNILSNAYSGLQTVPVSEGNVFLSFLPLSHTLERTVGYYLPMMAGATVAHNRSIPELPQDLASIRPTALISVPRIFERVYARVKDNLANAPASTRALFRLSVIVGWRRFLYEQGRKGWHPNLLMWPLLKRLVADKVSKRLGGKLAFAISGGAALSPEVSRVFLALGIPVLQGYGLTEASPVVSVNRLDANIPASIGIPLPGVEVRLGENDELLVKGDNVMQGYWNNREATDTVIDADGWLHSGDKARIDGEHIYITGRIKDIIVLATGEKVPPTDMELAIANDHLFDQVMIIGEARSCLVALVVLNDVQWQKLARESGLPEAERNGPAVEKVLLERITAQLHDFPGYAEVIHVYVSEEAWTVENELLTPTLKVKRKQVEERFAGVIEEMYRGH